MSSYLDCSGRDDALSGGARMIPVRTPAGTYRVWVKRVGNYFAGLVEFLHDIAGTAPGS
jgi:proline iminopeptidase